MPKINLASPQTPPPPNRELHTRRLGSNVTMWFHTRTMGVRGHAPRIVFIKKTVQSGVF